jgi:hypothetical protein
VLLLITLEPFVAGSALSPRVAELHYIMRPRVYLAYHKWQLLWRTALSDPRALEACARSLLLPVVASEPRCVHGAERAVDQSSSLASSSDEPSVSETWLESSSVVSESSDEAAEEGSSSTSLSLLSSSS